MIRVIAFLASVLIAAGGLSWLADNPGVVHVEWPALNVKADPSVFQVVVGLAALLLAGWIVTTLVRHAWNSPANVGSFLHRRRHARGLDALSNGMIAIGAGDPASAKRYASLARKALPNEPLTHLLRAQAAQISGDTGTSRRIFEGMLASPDTEALGLRGLFTEAQRENELEAARQFAERALKLNPKLAWASTALFEMQCKAGDWEAALDTLASARRNDLIERPFADRRRAILLTGLAIRAEDADPARALALATEAHGLAPDLVPAASLAGRMLASRANTAKAAKILQKTWTLSPHPDLATAYAYARIGDSPRDRLDRVKQLADISPHAIESAVAVANAAIDAKSFDEARKALEPLLEGRLTQNVATLMARIESEQFADKGRVREWLARAVNAPRDPVWTADGIISDQWAPISPVTGQLDAFHWKVPVETHGARDDDLVSRKIEELVALGRPRALDLDDAEEETLTSASAVRASGQQSTAAPASPALAPAQATQPKFEDAITAAATPMSKPAAEPKEARTLAPSAAASTPATAKTGEGLPSGSTQPAKAIAQVPAATIKPVSARVDSRSSTKPPIEPTTSPPASAQPSVADKPQPTSKPSAARPAQTSNATKDASGRGPTSKDNEPRIFVVPHAPDDPGPETGEPEEAPVKGARPPYRAVP